MSKLNKDSTDSSSLRTEQLLKQILQQITAVNNFQRFLALGPEKICQFLYGDRIFSIHLPFADTDLIQKRILTTGHFFELPHLRVVQKIIPPQAVIIDAGANIGNHTLFFAGVCGAEKVYSFEPLHEVFRILEKNIHLNDFTQVTPINAALGAATGYADLSYYTPTNIGKSSFVCGTEGGYKMTSIDTLALDRLDFIKMDVEGSQMAALEGARATLTRCRPVLWIELRRKFGEYEPAATLLHSMGYQLERALGPDDFLFVPATA